MTHRIAVYVRDGLLAMELGIVHRLFGQARSDSGDPLYEVITCTDVPGPIRTDSDVRILVERGLDAVADADTVIVPASDADYASDGTVSTLFEGLSTQRLASICTGSFVLAAAGLLDGKRATTHWKSAALFAELYPQVLLDPNVLYTEDGNVLTAAGEASGIDLCLHMIRQDFGAAVANRVARGTVVPPHRNGGQAQYIDTPVPRTHSTSTAAAQEWALRNLRSTLSVEDLARHQAMSVRTFSRRFVAEVGVSPARWIVAQRVQRARELLENTDLTIERIAHDTGFGTATSLRNQIAAELGVSPSAYRATFRVGS
ncbi:MULTISPECIES: GlxA family transcriptional regulator [unclassified Rhodococcus (in: high G+C Gram-positive bacteria)]|uniref:GlxA family transcriptional regulator n=1 Tax=unclassified Rhodococcus (in: high G+C Gram-positive bacteria) TaxID=192944 RepID=UPI0015C6862D|nr:MULTISPECIES: helix-turn-helix domain-containing protein [unclassified Rhodococcus (in: high G+C Gram-positive bacteria)]